jgi:hypothetical protein
MRLRLVWIAATAAAVLLLGGSATAVVGQVGATQLVSRATGLATIPPGSIDGSISTRQAVSQDGRFVVFASQSDGLSSEDNDRLQNIFVRDRLTNTTTLVSRASGAAGAAANASSTQPAISADGTHVTWVSTATNLDPAGTNGTHLQVYVRDLNTYVTQLVSISNGPSAVEANATAWFPSISADGTRIAFVSAATNLGTAVSHSEIWVRDISGSPTTSLVSKTNTTNLPADRDCNSPSISGDGNSVAFDTAADMNVGPVPSNIGQVYLRSSGSTTLISTGPSGAGDQSSLHASVNDDGTKIAFASAAHNLDPADSDFKGDIYVRDTIGAATFLVSRADGLSGSVGDKYSANPAISGDGKEIAFESTATNLVADDTNGSLDVFVRTLNTGSTKLVARAGGASGAIGDFGADTPAISKDGSTVTFESYSTTIDPNSDWDFEYVYARDLGADTTDLVSRPDGTGPFGTGATAYNAIAPGGISADGRYVLFQSDSNDFVPGIDNRWTHLFVRDTLTNTTTLVDVGLGGAPANGWAYQGTISADGTRVAFLSSSSNLVPGDTNGRADVFVHDLSTGQTTRADTKLDGSELPDGAAYVPVLDATGIKVAFDTRTAISPDDTNSKFDVYVRDLSAGTIVLASRASSGAVGNDDSTQPWLSAAGNRVAFASRSSNFVPGVPAGVNQIYLRDLGAATTTLVSRADGPVGAAGDADSYDPTLSAGGNRVEFDSSSTDLSPDATTSGRQVYVRDANVGMTTLASRRDGAGGLASDGSSYAAQLSSDGNLVLFSSGDSSLVPADTNGSFDVFLRNLSTGTTTLVSRASGAAGAISDGSSFGGALSGNGHCVGFRSSGGNLVPEVGPTDFPMGYLRTIAGECPNDPPGTTLASAPSGKIKSRSATFTFTSNDSTATFQCSLDGAAFAACSSGQSYAGLADGAHEFQVRAVDPAGNVDSTPESATWQVDATGPVLKLVVPRQHLRRVLPRSRFWCYITSSEGASGNVRLFWKGKLIGRVSIRVGPARASIPIKLRLKKKQRRALKRARSAKFVLVVTAADDLGNPTILKRTLVLRR